MGHFGEADQEAVRLVRRGPGLGFDPVGESLHQFVEQFVRREPLLTQVSRWPRMAISMTARMKIPIRLKPTMIPANAKPSPPNVPFDRLIRLRETKPKVMPRIHGTPKRKGMMPTHEQTRDATARPLVGRGWGHADVGGVVLPYA
jgi:hypothetical protein